MPDRKSTPKGRARFPTRPARTPNIGPARLGGNISGSLPSNLNLPGSVVVTQGFHPGHTAYDLAGPAGMPIYAPRPLTIQQAGFGLWGNDVIGVTGEGNRLIFGHFQSVAPGLVPGQRVPAGTLLGYEGTTYNAAAGGYSTGPHLHFEERGPGGERLQASAADLLNSFVPVGKSTPLAAPAGRGGAVPASSGYNPPVGNGSPAPVAVVASVAKESGPVVSSPAPVTALGGSLLGGGVSSIFGPSTGQTSPLGIIAEVSKRSLTDYAFIGGGVILAIIGLMFILKASGMRPESAG